MYAVKGLFMEKWLCWGSMGVAGLLILPDVTRFYVNSYLSLCFNRLLSYHLKRGTTPQTLPLLHPETKAAYMEACADEPIDALSWQQPGLTSISVPNRSDVPTMVLPIVHGCIHAEIGTHFHFDLVKGAYATAFLAEFYELHQANPVPAWVSDRKVETRALFGYPSVALAEAVLE